MQKPDTASLRLSIERSLEGAFDPADVLPRLAQLVRLAPEESDDGIYAHTKLAELVVERDPWRAALYVRRVLAHRPHDDRPWAILAFCQTLLGNFRSAARAYEHAIACAPANPTYAHNLGHLLDVALGQPAPAVGWLRKAHDATPGNAEIVASFAHALGRAGKLAEAKALLQRTKPSCELAALLVWIENGAPKLREERRPGTPQPRTKLTRELARGLASLPLDPRQRQRAMAMARDLGDRRHAPATAAAVAYAIVFIDRIPLSLAEVAAPFRVGLHELRGRFAELRAELDIIRGDRRYARARP